MGGKPRPKDRSWHRRQIRKVNQKFKEKGLSTAKKDQLMDLKDMLIDGLMLQCAHSSLLHALPDKEELGPKAHTEVRICLLCGDVEHLKSEWLKLTGSAKTVDRSELTIQLGIMLKDMGINL